MKKCKGNAAMEAALNKAFPDRTEAQLAEEKPKRKYRTKTEKEKADKAEKARAKRESKHKKCAEEKRQKFMEQLEAHWELEREKLKEERERSYRKFTCPELIRIFGGWFTLTYAFSIKKITKGKGGKNVEVDTDYYICSKDVSHMNINERPALNKIIQKEYGKDVYGFAIIAPASAFSEGGTEL